MAITSSDSTRHVFLRHATKVADEAKATLRSTDDATEIVISQFRGVRSWSSKINANGPFSWKNVDALDEIRITVRDVDSPATFPNKNPAGIGMKIGLHVVWQKGKDEMEHREFSPSNQHLLKRDLEAAKAACEMVRDLLNLSECPDGSNPNEPRNRNLFNGFSKVGNSTYYIYQDVPSSNITAKMIADSLRNRGFAIPEIPYPMHLDLRFERNAGSNLQAAWTMAEKNMDVHLWVRKGENIEVLEENSLTKIRGHFLKWDDSNGPSFVPFTHEKDVSTDSPLSQSRHSTRIQPARTFHPQLITTIKLPEILEPKNHHHFVSTCSLNVLYTLPPSIFVDPYQLADLTPQSLAGTESGRILGVWGEADLEKPVDQVRGWGSLVLVRAANGASLEGHNGTVSVTLPAHARYQPPRGDGAFEISVELQTPDVFWMCENSNERAETSTPPPISFLFPPPPPNHHREFFPLKTNPLEGSKTVFVPVGRIQDIAVVGAITPIAAVLACVVVCIGMWMQAKGTKKVHTT